MGSDTYSSARLEIAKDNAVAPALASTVERLLDIAEIGGDIDTTGDHIDTVASAVATAFDADEVDIDCGEDQLVISASGWGRRRGVDEMLQILADAGFTGQVICEDECSNRWRHRIGDDGRVHLDDATTVYSGGPISEVWIVQMQSPDDGELDHVAVVGAHEDAEAILAGWVRDDARALIAERILDQSRIDLESTDFALLGRWAEIGGVKWEVYQPR